MQYRLIYFVVVILFAEPTHVLRIYDNVTQLYNRLVKSQANIANILDSINVWGNIPLYKRNEAHQKCLLNIDNRDFDCRLRAMEAINSKELIRSVMDENYCLFFDLPVLTPVHQPTDKNRLRKTILQQLDRHTTVMHENYAKPIKMVSCVYVERLVMDTMCCIGKA